MTARQGSSLAARLVLALALCVVAGGSSTSVAAEVSFKGKTINNIINSNPGGGTDGSARLVSTYLSKYLPGEPQIIFRNLPGGGGTKANNYFYSRVEPDGLTFIAGSREQLSPVKLLHEGTKYNPAEYEFIGGFSRSSSPLMIRSKDRHRLTDLKAKPLVYGDPTGERTAPHAAVWGKEYLGWNVRFVFGYASSAAAVLAFRAGETDMASSFLLEPYMEEDGLEVIADLGMQSEDSTKVLSHPSFPNAPLFDDLIRPKLDAKGLRAYQIWLADQVVDKWIALPPKTSKDIADTYRAAFLKAMKDPKFIEGAKEIFDKDYSWLSAERLSEIVTKQVATTRDDLTFFIDLRRKNGLPVLER